MVPNKIKPLTDAEMLEWIDRSSFEDLLRKQRFAPIGDPYFDTLNHPRVASHFAEMFLIKRAASAGGGVVVSKKVGWDDKPGEDA